MTPADFESGIERLSLLRGMPDDVAPYWDLFRDVPSVDWNAGVSLAIKTRTFFPVPAELFEDCEQAKPPRVWQSEYLPVDALRTETIRNPFGSAPLVVTVYREWKYYCERCSDSGWVSHWCGGPPPKPWQFRTTCRENKEHRPHEWAAVCSCALSNPAVQNRRELTAKAAVTGVKRK